MEPFAAHGGGTGSEAPAAPAGPVVPAEIELPPSARTRAGLGLILAVGGTGLGLWLGGLPGAGAGLLLMGAARNGLRATRGWASPDPIVRHDAGTSASLAVLGTVIGGYLSYRVYQKRQGED